MRWRRCGRILRIQRGPGRSLVCCGERQGYTHIALTFPFFMRGLARLFVATPARRCNKTTSKFKKRCVNGMQDLSLDAKFQPHPPGSLLARQAAVARLVAALAHQQPWCRSAMRAEVHHGGCIDGRWRRSRAFGGGARVFIRGSGESGFFVGRHALLAGLFAGLLVARPAVIGLKSCWHCEPVLLTVFLYL